LWNNGFFIFHCRDSVRKKAVVCLHAFINKAPDITTHVTPLLHKSLCDRDPGVVWAVLHIIYDLAKVLCDQYGMLFPIDTMRNNAITSQLQYSDIDLQRLHFQTNPQEHQHLIPTLVNILDQIVSRKLTAEYEYHTVPAPWLQILLLKILGKFGAGNKECVLSLFCK